jgi:hypothetical protein
MLHFMVTHLSVVLNLFTLIIVPFAFVFASRARKAVRTYTPWMGKPIRILLDEKLFTALVAGKVVEINGPDRDHMQAPAQVRIILSDIGYDRMSAAITRAMSGRSS